MWQLSTSTVVCPYGFRCFDKVALDSDGARSRFGSKILVIRRLDRILYVHCHFHTRDRQHPRATAVVPAASIGKKTRNKRVFSFGNSRFVVSQS